MSNKETKVFTFNENNQTIRVDAEAITYGLLPRMYAKH